MNRLQQKWFEKISRNEKITIEDLYEFSNIKLKRSRIRKKFRKYYERYVPKEICDTYRGILFASPLVNSFSKFLDFNLEPVEPSDDMPEIKLIYPDFNYE